LAALALLVTMPADAKCRYSKFAALQLDTSERSPHVEGVVNGQPIKVLLDTGATGTSLMRPVAERLQLPLSHTDDRSFGIGGDSEKYHASVKEFGFGPARWKNIRMAVTWDSQDDSIDAMVGANYLLQNDIELLLRDKLIHFFKPEDCKDTFLGYWDPDATVLPMIDLRSGDLRAEVMIQVNGKPVRALIDTGAYSSFIDEKAAASLGVQKPADGSAPEKTVVGIGTREVAAWVGRFDSVAIGAEVIQHTKLTVMDMWGAARRDLGYWGSESLDNSPQVVLGADFLTSHRVLLAMSQRKVYLSYLGGPVFAAAATKPASTPSAPEAAASAP
jgi:predicted aspartyl protease